jgi:MFS family permease
VQFGMLHGLAFAVTFCLFGLAAGTFADRYNRRRIVFIAVAVWSLATAACGLAREFWHLLLARVGVGAGEAGLNPCATSMITDMFPPARLTMALAVYALGASAGSGCAFLFGGMLVDVVTNADAFVLPILGEVRPWQAVFLIIGVPGIFLALLSFTMPEPARRGRLLDSSAETPKSLVQSYRTLFSFMRSRGRFFSLHYTGFGLASLGIIGGTAWYPAHMGREFGWSGTDIGLGLGFAMIAGGIIGKLSCGAIVKYLFERGYKDAPFRWYAIALLLAVPPGVVGLTSDNPWVFLTGFTLLQILVTPLNVVYVASLNLVTPNELRGSGVALFSATVGLIAMSLGAILIAAISDYVYGGNAIGLGIATLYALCLPAAALALFSGRAAMREAVTAAEAWH